MTRIPNIKKPVPKINNIWGNLRYNFINSAISAGIVARSLNQNIGKYIFGTFLYNLKTKKKIFLVKILLQLLINLK